MISDSRKETVAKRQQVPVVYWSFNGVRGISLIFLKFYDPSSWAETTGARQAIVSRTAGSNNLIVFMTVEFISCRGIESIHYVFNFKFSRLTCNDDQVEVDFQVKFSQTVFVMLSIH